MRATLNMHQNCFWPGLCPGLRCGGGAYDPNADPLVGWGEDTPPHSLPLDTFGLAIWVPSVLPFLFTPIQIPDYGATHYVPLSKNSAYTTGDGH